MEVGTGLSVYLNEVGMVSMVNQRKFDRWGLVVALFPAGLFFYLLAQLSHVQAGGALEFILPWIPSLGDRG